MFISGNQCITALSDFRLFRSTSDFTGLKSQRAPPSSITQRMEVLHFKLNMWLKDLFSSVSYIHWTYVRPFEQKGKKCRGSSTTSNCLARSLSVEANVLLESGHVTPRRLRSHAFGNNRRFKTP